MYFEKFPCFFLRLPKIFKKIALNLKEYILMEITRYEKQFKNLLLKVMLSKTKPKESRKNLCFFWDCQIGYFFKHTHRNLWNFCCLGKNRYFRSSSPKTRLFLSKFHRDNSRGVCNMGSKIILLEVFLFVITLYFLRYKLVE